MVGTLWRKETATTEFTANWKEVNPFPVKGDGGTMKVCIKLMYRALNDTYLLYILK